MAHYQGLTISEMVQYILGVCQSKGWRTNVDSIKTLLNEANSELNAMSGIEFELFTTTTVSDTNNYEMPDDLHHIKEALIQKTGDDGAYHLKPTTLSKILESLADDAETDTVEP